MNDIADFGLSARIVDDLRTAFGHYPEIESVLLFGSRAIGSHRFNSDLDLAVCAPSMTDSRFAALWVEVDELPIIFKIDMLHLERTGNPQLRTRILEEGVRFYGV